MNSEQQGYTIHRRPDDRLVLVKRAEDGSTAETPVRASSCFPWTLPDKFISFADDKGRELLLVEELESLPEEQRRLVQDEIRLKNFVPRIEKIHAIGREIELFHWKVSTSAGPRAFLTHRHEAPRSLHGGRVLVRDINNDLYLVENVKRLDPRSLRLLWMYLD